MENRNYKSEDIERNNLNIVVKNSLLELEKDIINLKDIELKDRKVKIKKLIVELFIKPILVSI